MLTFWTQKQNFKEELFHQKQHNINLGDRYLESSPAAALQCAGWVRQGRSQASPQWRNSGCLARCGANDYNDFSPKNDEDAYYEDLMQQKPEQRLVQPIRKLQLSLDLLCQVLHGLTFHQVHQLLLVFLLLLLSLLLLHLVSLGLGQLPFCFSLCCLVLQERLLSPLLLHFVIFRPKLCW